QTKQSPTLAAAKSPSESATSSSSTSGGDGLAASTPCSTRRYASFSRRQRYRWWRWRRRGCERGRRRWGRVVHRSDPALTGRCRGGGEGSHAWRTWTTPSPSPMRTTLSAAPWAGPGHVHHGDRLRGRSPRVRGARRHRGRILMAANRFGSDRERYPPAAAAVRRARRCAAVRRR
ncbi:Os09g0124850, partial [Oryza sativa Japonica Group]